MNYLGGKRMELLLDTVEQRDYAQLKDLFSDQDRDRWITSEKA